MKTNYHSYFLRTLLPILLLIACTSLFSSEVKLGDAIGFAYREMQNNNWDLAQKWLAYVLGKDSSNFDAQFLQVQLEIHNESYSQALQRMDWLICARPELLEYRILRLNILDLMGNSKAAQEEAKRILAVDSSNIDARAFLNKTENVEVVPTDSRNQQKPAFLPDSMDRQTLVKKTEKSDGGSEKNAARPESFREMTRLILSNPDVLTKTDWSFDQSEEKSIKPDEKVLQLFVQWKFGEIGSIELGKELKKAKLKMSSFVGDKEVLAVLDIFLREGLLEDERKESSRKLANWLDFLTDHCRLAMMSGNLEEAWQSHLDAVSEGSTWHYCAARIMLDRWAMSGGREQTWLQTARGHLENCLTSPIWKSDAEVLLSEINSRLR